MFCGMGGFVLMNHMHYISKGLKKDHLKAKK